MSQSFAPVEAAPHRITWRDLLRLEGRASRAEFRSFFYAFLVLIAAMSAALLAIDQAFGGGDGRVSRDLLGSAVRLAAYAGFFVLVAVMVRRLHDFGWRGWWVLLYLVPPAPIVMIAFFWFGRGQPGPNRFGPVPPQRVRLF